MKILRKYKKVFKSTVSTLEIFNVASKNYFEGLMSLELPLLSTLMS